MTASPLELAGLLIACGAAAAALVAPDRRLRYPAVVIALLAAPALLAGDVWHQARFADLRAHPLELAALLVAVAALVLALAAAFERYPALFPLVAIALLPLRVPIKVGGQTSDLLIPLYAVIAAEALRRAYRVLPARRERRAPASLPEAPLVAAGPRRWILRLLAAILVLYALQAAYSEDVSNAIENASFFLVPFAVLFVLLLEIEWRPRLLAWALAVAGTVALAFAGIAFWQEASRHLTFNTELIAANQIHTYFRVNSLFHDPNVLGRYLALAAIALAAAAAWLRDPRLAVAAAATACVLVAALTFTYSLTSIAALFAGLGVVAWLRFGLRAALGAAALVIAALGAYLALSGTASSDLSPKADITEGRVPLVRGGIDLWRARPLWGYGSGSFGAAFERHIRRAKTTTSHSEPITVAAEQGVIGLVPYLALLAVALAVLLAGASRGAASAAVAACFVAMIVHSLGYAGFAIDPATWALLALGLRIR